MDQGKRPGGLTALAVLNFIFCGSGFLGLLSILAMFALISVVPFEEWPEPDHDGSIEVRQDAGVPVEESPDANSDEETEVVADEGVAAEETPDGNSGEEVEAVEDAGTSTRAERNRKANMEKIEGIKEVGIPGLLLMSAFSLTSSVLLLISGIGYIRQKKFSGRVLGSLYGVVEIVNNLVVAMVFAPVIGSGFTIATIIGLVYPILTLILINTTFRDDFMN